MYNVIGMVPDCNILDKISRRNADIKLMLAPKRAAGTLTTSEAKKLEKAEKQQYVIHRWYFRRNSLTCKNILKKDDYA